MSRRKRTLDPADFPPLVEVALDPGAGLMTREVLSRQCALADQRVHAAAPALACLDCLEIESALCWSGKALVLAYRLRMKKQVALWAGLVRTQTELDTLIRQDLQILSRSIVEAQNRLDRLADKLRQQRASAAEEREAARICVSMRETLTSEEEQIVAVLRRHAGRHLDLSVPVEGDMRFVFPPYEGGAVRRPSLVRLRARAETFNCESVHIFHISLQRHDEWQPLPTAEGAPIELVLNAAQDFEDVAPIIKAVWNKSFVEFTAILFVDALTGAPRRAEWRCDAQCSTGEATESVSAALEYADLFSGQPALAVGEERSASTV
jgi:hypothetical protein